MIRATGTQQQLRNASPFLSGFIPRALTATDRIFFPVFFLFRTEFVTRAFEDFQRLYGVGSILDPDDPQCCEDEKANITYLAELMKAMPEHEDDDGEGGGRRGRNGVGEAAAVVNTRQVIRMEWAADTKEFVFFCEMERLGRERDPSPRNSTDSKMCPTCWM